LNQTVQVRERVREIRADHLAYPVKLLIRRAAKDPGDVRDVPGSAGLQLEQDEIGEPDDRES